MYAMILCSCFYFLYICSLFLGYSKHLNCAIVVTVLAEWFPTILATPDILFSHVIAAINQDVPAQRFLYAAFHLNLIHIPVGELKVQLLKLRCGVFNQNFF